MHASLIILGHSFPLLIVGNRLLKVRCMLWIIMSITWVLLLCFKFPLIMYMYIFMLKGGWEIVNSVLRELMDVIALLSLYVYFAWNMFDDFGW